MEPDLANYWDGKTIRLRAITSDDAEAMYRFNLTDDYGMIDRIFPPGSLARVQDWVDRQTLSGFDDHSFSFQMEDTETGELVGGIAAHAVDARIGIVGYGVWVFEGHRGKRYASEAICLVLRYYFQELRFQKANVTVYDINEPSKRLHESLGFQREAQLRRSVFTNGEYSDLLTYGMTVEEFRERHSDYWR